MATLDLDSYLNKIAQLTNNGSHEQAICHCLYLLRQFPRNLEIYKSLGRLFVESGRTIGALETFLRVCNTEPEDSLNHLTLVWLFSEIGDVKNVYLHCRTALSLQPGNTTLYDELNQWLNILPEKEQSEFSWLDLFSEGMTAFLNKDFKYSAGRFLEAVKSSGNVLPELFYTIALFSMGMEAEAVPYLDHILEVSPYCLTALRMRAFLSSDRDPVLFNQDLQRLIDIDPGYEHWVIQKGQIHPNPFPIRIAYFDWTGVPNAQIRIGRHQAGEKILQSGNTGLPQWLKLLPLSSFDIETLNLIRISQPTETAVSETIQKSFFANKAKNETDVIPQISEKTETVESEKPNELDQAFSFLEQIAEKGFPNTSGTPTPSESITKHPNKTKDPDRIPETIANHPVPMKEQELEEPPLIPPKRKLVPPKTVYETNDANLQMVRNAWRCFSMGNQTEGVKLYRELTQNHILPDMVRSDLEKLVILFPDVSELNDMLSTSSEDNHTL